MDQLRSPTEQNLSISITLGLAIQVSLSCRCGERGRRALQVFYYVHLCMIPLWLTLLFIHGSNNWIGVGFPQAPARRVARVRSVRFGSLMKSTAGGARLVVCSTI